MTMMMTGGVEDQAASLERVEQEDQDGMEGGTTSGMMMMMMIGGVEGGTTRHIMITMIGGVEEEAASLEKADQVEEGGAVDGTISGMAMVMIGGVVVAASLGKVDNDEGLG